MIEVGDKVHYVAADGQHLPAIVEAVENAEEGILSLEVYNPRNPGTTAHARGVSGSQSGVEGRWHAIEKDDKRKWEWVEYPDGAPAPRGVIVRDSTEHPVEEPVKPNLPVVGPPDDRTHDATDHPGTVPLPLAHGETPTLTAEDIRAGNEGVNIPKIDAPVAVMKESRQK